MIARVSTTADTLAPGHLAWHRHPATMLGVPKSGRYREVVIGGHYDVQQGLAVITNALAPHADKIEQGGLNITNLSLPDLGISGVFELPKEARRSGWPRDARDVSGVLADLKPIEMIPVAKWLQEAFKILIENQSITLTAREIGLTREHFQRSFLAGFAMTPGQALREFKLSQSLKALSGLEPLAEIAVQCRFSDQSHMTRVVKTATGMTPREIQQKNITSVQ